jgi:hypothetical protein
VPNHFRSKALAGHRKARWTVRVDGRVPADGYFCIDTLLQLSCTLFQSPPRLGDAPLNSRNTLNPKGDTAVNSNDKGSGSSDIFQDETQATPRPLAPPDYRQQALRLIISLNLGKGLSSLSFSELALQMRDQALRDYIDPSFEPLSLESINAAVTDLVRTHELTIINDRTVIFPALPKPGA